MSEAIIEALRRRYMESVGNPAAQLIGGGVRGYLGLDAPAYADGLGMEAYRNAAAIGNTPVVGMPSMAVRAGARAAPAVAESLRKHAKGFQEYNRALGPAGASQATVWHGSPHKFDAFDSSKIGSGSGVNAQGYGHYSSDADRVAKEWAGSDGFVYKVDIPDEKINQMLNWQQRIQDQPKSVRKSVLNAIGADRYKSAIRGKETGQGLYDNELAFFPAEEASLLLSRSGIPGIRYQGNSTTNTVVFPGNEELMTIIERNGEIINALRKRN